MNLYQLDKEDKINCINRSFFDAEHGWITLALNRLESLFSEFPNDPQVLYSEGLIRKDFLGQGIKAEEYFLAAQKNASERSKRNEIYPFATFNSAKYARNINEYNRQKKIARELAPNDPDLVFFDEINHALSNGMNYAEILANAVAEYQHHGKHGDCAAFAELALQAGEHSLDDEMSLRRARMGALRELDKVASNSRNTRGENYPPEERLTLHEAMAEMEQALSLDPEDHTLWNFKSAWLYLLNKPEEAIVAADRALALCPVGYVKPHHNKALIYAQMKKWDEARRNAEKALDEAQKLGEEGLADRELAQRFLADMDTPELSDHQKLVFFAKRIVNAAVLTAKQEMTQWKGPGEGAEPSDGTGILKGLKDRVAIVGRRWNPRYISLMAEFLIFFCPETAWMGVLKLSDSHQEEYQHCINSVLYIAAHEDGVKRRDACRFMIILLLGAKEPDLIRKSYREAVLGPTAVELGGFKNLEHHMREEMARLNPALIKLVADQPPLTQEEFEWAKRITMSRFLEGISRDPVPANSCKKE
jgi:tetratricopeptide (TPR) repeat protein